MKQSDGFNHSKPRMLRCAALCGCLLTTAILVCLIKSNSSSIDAGTLKLQLFNMYPNASSQMVQKQASVDRQAEPQPLNGQQHGNDSVPEAQINEGGVVCDYTGYFSDTCWIDGDVRVLGKSATIVTVVASPPADQLPTVNMTWKIKPYMGKPYSSELNITELSMTLSEEAPRCTANHSVPAVFFSTGGFVSNYFHDFSDVIVPLFLTSRRFNGEVQFVATDFNHDFFDKYQPILKQLSRYPVIDMDADEIVHCFPQAHVGLLSHKILGIDDSRSPNGITMQDFRSFLRTCFSLQRNYSGGLKRRKPRLLLILRKGSRSFTNEAQVVSGVRELGFELITAGPEEAKNLHRFAQLVNSVDVMVGVHGAGLTNMIFLPTNATVVQIIPCCGMKLGCRYLFSDPAPDMGLRYVDYEIAEKESSLIDEYPRDDVVFKDPRSILDQGFVAYWKIFLKQQKVKLDVARLKSMLVDVVASISSQQ